MAADAYQDPYQNLNQNDPNYFAKMQANAQAKQSYDMQAQLAQLTQSQQDLIAKAGARMGQPDRPEFESLLDPNTGMMPDKYSALKQYDTSALDAMKSEALRAPGEQSQWRQAMQAQLQQQGGKAAAGAQAQTSAAMNQLAMKGGLGAGSAERMGNQGALRGLQAQQQIMGQGLGLDVQDENNRLQQLGQVNQGEMGRVGVAQYDIEKNLGEVLQKRASDINAYNEQMRAWASEKTAAATPSSGGGGKK